MRLFFLMIFFYIGVIAAVAQDKIQEGGECEYEKYNCKIKIITIEKFLSSSSPEKPKYKVRFEVLPTKQLPEKIVYRTAGREYIMLLNNMAYPGPLYLEKYHISSGKVFDCYYHIIIRGTCTSSFFTFPDINLDDYFENQPQSEKRR